MTERPILFSGPMVRAILDGRKTQTRRVVKGVALDWLQPGMFTPEYVASPDSLLSPYGFPGDRLWVRESFWGCDSPETGDTPCVVYDDEWHGKVYRPAEIRPWAPRFGRIPSIHMPRDCSRITLEVTNVRIERLQEISVEDAEDEGCKAPIELVMQMGCAASPSLFRELWESLSGVESWNANPWVWVVEFKRAA